MPKKVILATCLAVLLSLAVSARADLILHWKLDEGSGTIAHDASGNARDRVMERAPKWTAGKIGGGLEFGGTGDRVVDDDGENYLNGLSALTIAVWIKSDLTNTDKGFIDGEDPDGNDNVCTIRYDAAGASFGGTSVMKMAVTSTPGGEQQLESSANVQTTEWQHIAMTWVGGGLIRLYINGVENTPTGRNGPNNAGVVSGCTTFVVGQGGKDTSGGWDGLVDDVRIYNEALTAERIQGIMKGEGYPYAFGPNPADGAIHADTWVNLSWTPGDFAASHNVYLGDNFADVSAGTGGTFRGNQTSPFFVAGFPGFPYPEGLVPGTTYYWRIDEVNTAEPNSPWKGPIWSFSIPPKTAYNPNPADGAQFVGPDNVTLSWTPGFGSKLHTVYFGDDFTSVSNAVGGLPQGTATYKPASLQAEKIYYWRVDEFDGTSTHKGNIWAFTTPGAAGSPKPANGASGVQMVAKLNWTPATNATSHQVYFGTDKEAVKNATTASPEYKGSKAKGSERYDPGKLTWYSPYYWRVDAVYSTGTVKGLVWSFTTADFITVDDFESYNDIDPPDPASNRIFDNWIDGFATPTTNGALVGNEMPPYTERTIVHSGMQSMPYAYDNNLKTSEATLTLVYPRDWTEEGVTKLSLWFRGASANSAERMYVALNGSAVFYHADPKAAQTAIWTEWVIDLQAFQGVTLTNVNTITIGFGTKGSPAAGGAGRVFFDDIALYRSAP